MQVRRWLQRRLRTRAIPDGPTGIHLSWCDDPATTLAVSWLTPPRAEPAAVELRRGDGGAVQRVSAARRRLRGTPLWQNQAVLRGLTGSTTSIDAGYGASPNGGYTSSSNMKYASARTRHRR